MLKIFCKRALTLTLASKIPRNLGSCNLNYSLKSFCTVGKSTTNKQAIPAFDQIIYDIVDGGRSYQLISVLNGVVTASKNIFDYIPEKGPVTSKEIAQQTGLNEDSIFRCLRYLSQHGYTSQDENDEFSHTPKSLELRGTGGEKVKPVLDTHLCDELHTTLRNVKSMLEKDSNCFYHTHNQHFIGPNSFLANNPDRNAAWMGHMKLISTQSTLNSLINLYNLDQFETICDVGGSMGHVIESILTNYLNVKKGILFDMPEVCELARTIPGIGDNINLDIVAGSFFNKNDLLKVKADCFILKFVLHDWNDDECITILKNIRQTMEVNQTLIVYEPGFIDTNKLNQIQYVIDADMHMAMLTSGAERTVQQIDKLFNASGFKRDGPVLEGLRCAAIVAKAI